jgi:hypothetical protein
MTLRKSAELRSMRSCALVVVSAVVLFGACTSPNVGSLRIGRVAASVVPPSGDVVRIVAYSDNDGPMSRVILTGAIGDFGTATSVSSNGEVNTEHNDALELSLSHGTFRLDIAALDQHIVDAFRDYRPNPDTCSGNVDTTGTAPIVADSGTGSYGGIQGSFDLAVAISEVGAISQCNSTAQDQLATVPFLSQAIIITGAGTVTLP